MPTFCANCNINWARLASQDQGDEQYEFCPVCNTDHHLQASDNREAFMYSSITGQIINVQSGKELTRQAIPHQLAPIKITGKIDWESDEQKSAREIRAVDAYIKAMEQGKDGEQAYFETLKAD